MRLAPCLVALVLVGACIKPAPVPCVDASDCDVAPGGACVASTATAWCAYADPACPVSQQRYASDVGDTLAGTCVPALESCEPGEFQTCSGDQLTRCNATGTATETILCELGCSEALAGCQLCAPSTTACTNGTVATCDADGRPTATRACPLGCFEDEPRCREIVPSNGLGQFLAGAETAPDIVLADGEWFDAEGAILDADGVPTGARVPAHLVSAPSGGVPIVALVVRSISLGHSMLLHTQLGRGEQVPAIAVVSAKDITVRGLINVSGRSSPQPGETFTFPRNPPGSITLGSTCLGRRATETSGASPGSGGGGHATAGGDGGRASGGTAGAGGVVTDVRPSLTPLRGGCAGGFFDENGGYGGGAVQLVSGTRLVLLPGAAINAGGGGGSSTLGPGGGGGGGSGGGILLEAPIVELRAGAGLAANGGGGGGANATLGETGGVSLAPAAGGAGCPGVRSCSAGGAGATATTAPSAGVEALPAQGSEVLSQAGGGGGAVGLIRINTLDATYVVEAGVILSPLPSTGPLPIR
jgi:hypothetical protein